MCLEDDEEEALTEYTIHYPKIAKIKDDKIIVPGVKPIKVKDILGKLL